MKTLSKRTAVPFQLPFYTIRHVSSPEDLANNRRVYVGQTHIKSIVELPTDENVRDFLLEAEGKKRKVPTQVHRAVIDTLKNNPDNFSVLNSGIVIVARACDIDEKASMLLLSKPSIINGSQTQGIIKMFLSDQLKDNPAFLSDFSAHVKFEIIVTDNEDLIAETSISRNFQNDVMTISIAGRLGQLDELEQALQAQIGKDTKLQKSETKLSDDYVKTEKLLQIIAALTPEELLKPIKHGEINKVYTYSMKAKCLKDFQDTYKRAHDPADPNYPAYRELYQFYLDMPAQALDLYSRWQTHKGFKGTGLRAIERNGGEIVAVPDGFIFPILAALSEFAKKTDQGWQIQPPSMFDDCELIRSAKSAYMEIAHSNPWNMGKSKACYSQLKQITSIYKRLGDLAG